MNIKEITKSILDLATPKNLRELVDNLLNRNEELTQINNQNLEKIKRLEAENRKLKGLPVRPEFSPKDKTSDLDDEDEDPPKNDEDKKKRTGKKRSDAAKKNRRGKKDLEVDDIKRVKVDASLLTPNYQYKGIRKVIVQDINFERNNICFELEKYYSADDNQTIEADLPAGYEGGYFGPNIIAYIKCCYYEGDITIPKIHRILKSIGIEISLRQINRIINDRPDELIKELDEAREAAIDKAGYQQIDDTVTKLLGSNFTNTTVTCNPFFSYLSTSESKNRENAIRALCGGKTPLYKMNEQAIIVAYISLKSLKIQLLLERHKGEKIYTKKEVEELFNHEDFIKLKPPAIRDIKTAMLVGAFYDGHLGKVGKALVSDDAPQFNNLYDHHALCWYHEMRHYKELSPMIKEYQDQLKMFFTEVKSMYRVFKKWCVGRTDKLRDYIFNWFNNFFKEKTGYKLLDERKKMTFNKMEKLLAPLWCDLQLPLQNNESERDIRGRKIKQKISMFDKTWAGVHARDFYISIKQTCRKNGVSFYKFLLDRQKRLGEIPQLAEIINMSIPQI